MEMVSDSHLNLCVGLGYNAGVLAMSSLRERVEGLIAKCRATRGCVWVAEELAAALAAEGQGEPLREALRELLDASPTSCNDDRLNQAQRKAEALLTERESLPYSPPVLTELSREEGEARFALTAERERCAQIIEKAFENSWVVQDALDLIRSGKELPA